MKKYDWSKEKVAEAVKNNVCYTDTLRELNIPVRGRNTDTLKHKINEYQIDISHFTFVSKDKGKVKRKSVTEYLRKGTTIKSCKLKIKLIEAGLKENKCEICGTVEWLGKPLICQLHHIDGDETNNELENLQMLCPNCHSQTENYCGSANKIEKPKKYCKNCGREIKYSKSGYCVQCSARNRADKELENRNKNFPSKEVLEKLIKEQPFTTIGKNYGVTDTAIRKWCKKYNLPHTKKEIKMLEINT